MLPENTATGCDVMISVPDRSSPGFPLKTWKTSPSPSGNVV